MECQEAKAKGFHPVDRKLIDRLINFRRLKYGRDFQIWRILYHCIVDTPK